MTYYLTWSHNTPKTGGPDIIIPHLLDKQTSSEEMCGFSPRSHRWNWTKPELKPDPLLVIWHVWMCPSSWWVPLFLHSWEAAWRNSWTRGKGDNGTSCSWKSTWKLPAAAAPGKHYALVGNVFIMSEASLIQTPLIQNLAIIQPQLCLHVSLNPYKQMD